MFALTSIQVVNLIGAISQVDIDLANGYRGIFFLEAFCLCFAQQKDWLMNETRTGVGVSATE